MKKLLLFLVFGSLAACTKDKTKSALDQLPPATQTGANTFGCLVNGVPVYTNLYKTDFSSNGVKYLDATWNYRQLILFVITNSNKRIDYDFTIQTASDSILGSHNEQHLECSVNLNPDGAGPKNGYYTTKQWLPSQITITKYTGNSQVGNIPGNILSGTFTLNLTNSSGDTLRVTNGRFDIKYQ